MMLKKLQENKYVTFWMEKKLKMLALEWKTSNPQDVSWTHNVIGLESTKENNRQSLNFINLKIELPLEATMRLNRKKKN